MNPAETLNPQGRIEIIVEHKDGRKEVGMVKNAILRKGRLALAKCLANEMEAGGVFSYFVNRMLFGTNGTSEGQTKYVQTDRDGLFGETLIGKGVIATVDEDQAQVVFTSVLTYNDANGSTLNEMALRLNNGELYSMATFPDLNKTSSIQITFNWRVSFV